MTQVIEAPLLEEDEMQLVYNWVDEIPLSRPKKNITRDFADGGTPHPVLMAEIVKHHLPTLVDIHNYSAAHSMQQKLYNWNTLNQKVFRKLGFLLGKGDIEKITTCVPEAVERALRVVQVKINDYAASGQREADNRGTDSPVQPAAPVRQVRAAPVGAPNVRLPKATETDLIIDKENTIKELKETIEVNGRQIMELKIKKLEQLVKLKDSKIQTLTNKLTAAGIQ